MNDAEKRIIRRILMRAFTEGLTVDVNDGEEVTVQGAAGPDPVVEALGTTGMDWLILRRDGKRVGSIFLVYGNAPDEVVNDYSWTEGNEQLLERISSTDR